MRQSLKTNINKGDSSADIDGQPIDTTFVYSISAQAISTGTATGDAKMQASNDPVETLAKDSKGNPIPVNWSDIPDATVSITEAGTFLIPKFDVCYKWVRPVFVADSGDAGTITVNVNTIGPS